jgi:putative acetyltransferase
MTDQPVLPSGQASTTSVRDEQAGDEPHVAAVIAAAFGRAAEADLVVALRQARALEIALVAERDGRIVGQVALSPVSVQGAFMPGILGLAPLAVAPDCRRQGIGARLVEAALRAAKAGGGKVVVVLGEPAYYRRFGFRPARGIGLTCPWPGTEEAFQALILASPWPRGLVRYHAAFDRA